MPDLTPAPFRSTANAIINLMGTLGGIYILVMIKVLLKEAADPSQTNYIPLMLSLVLFMVVAVAVVQPSDVLPSRLQHDLRLSGIDDRCRLCIHLAFRRAHAGGTHMET